MTFKHATNSVFIIDYLIKKIFFSTNININFEMNFQLTYEYFLN